MSDNNNSQTFTHENIRNGGIAIIGIIGMMGLMSWYMPISAEMTAQPILDNLSKAKSCQDVYHADVQNFMMPMMISLDPIISKKIDQAVQDKAHKYCGDLYIIEKKYGNISDSSKMSCNDLRLVIKNLPSDLIKSRVMSDYVSRCLTN